MDGVPAIRAAGRGTASGRYRQVTYRPAEHPWVEWTWRVERLYRCADLRRVDREDFAAAVSFVFGRPGLLNRNVPGIAYLWTSAVLPSGSVVEPLRTGRV